MTTFTLISEYHPGDLARIIHRSYARLLEHYPKLWKQEEEKWHYFDKQAFTHPQIGKCLFVTCKDKIPVGLASWDPRHWPDYGVIGQNCILPEFQGMGFGKKQIHEILRIFKEHGVKKAVVTTSEHPFFTPARQMYKKAGFKEVKKITGGPDPVYKIIEMEKYL